MPELFPNLESLCRFYQIRIWGVLSMLCVLPILRANALNCPGASLVECDHPFSSFRPGPLCFCWFTLQKAQTCLYTLLTPGCLTPFLLVLWRYSFLCMAEINSRKNLYTLCISGFVALALTWRILQPFSQWAVKFFARDYIFFSTWILLVMYKMT